MTNQGVLERPKNRAKVMAWLVEGKGPAEIASLITTKTQPVSRQAVQAFRDRHADELAPLVEAVEKQITDYAIASKVNRIAALDDMLARLQAEVAEYGIAITEVEYNTDGDEERRIETRNFRAGLVREFRGLMRDAAEELGQMPKTAAVALNDNRTYILQVVKSDDSIALG